MWIAARRWGVTVREGIAAVSDVYRMVCGRNDAEDFPKIDM